MNRRIARTVAVLLALASVAFSMAGCLPPPPPPPTPEVLGQWGAVLNWNFQGKHAAVLGNGKVLLWSTGDRRVRVEVGYGLEGVLPDGKTGAILDAYVIPKFKSGEFDEGVLAGVGALVSAARNEPIELPSAGSESYESDSPGIGTLLMGLLGAIPVSLGSVVGFRKWRRHRRRQCPSCQNLMVCLGETEDDVLLEKGQQAEERVGSVDYDVWKCPTCSHHFTLRYPKWISSFAKCPQCRHRTKSSTETTISSFGGGSSGGGGASRGY